MKKARRLFFERPRRGLLEARLLLASSEFSPFSVVFPTKAFDGWDTKNTFALLPAVLSVKQCARGSMLIG